jgi:hypothetical protein
MVMGRYRQHDAFAIPIASHGVHAGKMPDTGRRISIAAAITPDRIFSAGKQEIGGGVK